MAYSIPELSYLKNEFLLNQYIDLIYRNNIISFFLTNLEGDFENYNSSGQKSYVAVKSIQQLVELSLLAYEDGASPEIINNLKDGYVIPFFGNKQYWEIPAIEWEKFVYPANILLGDKNLVWTII